VSIFRIYVAVNGTCITDHEMLDMPEMLEMAEMKYKLDQK
jgi:hypothetical protein